MSLQPDFRPGLTALSLLLGLGAAACSSTAGPVIGPESGGSSGPSAPASGVEGRVYLTYDLPSENVPVMMIWTELDEPSGPGGGIEAGQVSVPVAEGALPEGAQVRVTRTDAAGRFVHPRSSTGGVTLRIGALPENCRRPPDRVVQLQADALVPVQIDVLCYGPKAPPLN